MQEKLICGHRMNCWIWLATLWMHLITRLQNRKTVDLGSVVSLSWARNEEYLKLGRAFLPNFISHWQQSAKIFPPLFEYSAVHKWKMKSMLESSMTEVLIVPLNLWNSHYLRSPADECDSLGIQSAELWECLRKQNKAIVSSTPGRILHIIMRTGNTLAWGPHYTNWFRVPSQLILHQSVFCSPASKFCLFLCRISHVDFSGSVVFLIFFFWTRTRNFLLRDKRDNFTVMLFFFFFSFLISKNFIHIKCDWNVRFAHVLLVVFVQRWKHGGRRAWNPQHAERRSIHLPVV